MNNLVIPPSPSWYLSNVITCNSNGTVAYGARHEVVIIKVNDDAEVTPYSLKYSFIPLAHKDRITCLAFAPDNATDNFKNCLATASDDGSVRLWDSSTSELKMINSGLKESQKITAVDWSQSDPNVVISISDQAIMYCWDLPCNKLRKINLGPKIYPLCLAVCPHDKQVVAVGAKSGIVLIVSLKGEGSIKFRLRSHDADVISLSWCPVNYNIFQEDIRAKDSPSNGLQSQNCAESKDNAIEEDILQNGKNESDSSEQQASKRISGEKKIEYLLASGGKDRTIFFWRAGTDGRYETFANFPQQPLASGYRSKMVGDKGGNTMWGCLLWIDPYTLLSGSHFGELLSWDLSNLKNSRTEKDKKGLATKSIKLLHGNHSKGVFSIACPIQSSKPNDERRVAWTTALDRRLIAFSLKSNEIMTELTTIGGVIYCMAVSPLDPNRIAIGVGDCKILVWNMGNTKKMEVSVHWQKINSKVMALDWHPTEENWLAFATGEGRVGLLDVNSSKPPIVFRQHHHRSVYRVLWAPFIKEKDESNTGKYEFALYSVGDGEVLQHSVKTPQKEPVNLKDIFKKVDDTSKNDKTPGRTEFIMNHDRSLISVGNENGNIYILDGKTYEKCSILIAYKKIIQCLSWHPASVTSDPSRLSPYSNWLAAASDSVKVFSISPDGKTFETIAVLSVQTEKIVDVCWSPHLNGHLVSVSYDYTAQVWDVINQAPLVNYNKHHNAVLSAVWSPLSPEFIISGSSDNTLRVWKISEQPDSRPTEKKKHRVGNLLKRITNAPEAVDTEPTDKSNLKKEKGVTKTTNSALSKNAAQTTDVDVNPVAEWESGQQKRVKGKSLFPVNASALNVSKHLDEYYNHWKSNKNKKESKVTDTDASIVINETPVNAETSTPVLTSEKEKELAYFDFFDDRKAIRRLMKVEEDQLRKENRKSFANYCSLWRGDITELIKDAMNRKCLDEWLMSLAPMSSYRVWQEACVVYSEQLANEGDYLRAASYLSAVHKVEEAVELLCEHKFYKEAVALAKCRLPSGDPVIEKVMKDCAEDAVSKGLLSLAAHCYLSIDDPLSASQVLARCKDLKSLKMAALLAREADAVEFADSLAKEAFCSSLMASDFDSCLEILSNHSNLEFLKIWIKINQILNENKRLDLPVLVNWLQGGEINIEPILDRVKEEIQSFGNCYEKLKSNVNCFNALDTEKQLWLYVSNHLSLAGAAESFDCSLHHLVQLLAAVYRFQTLNSNCDILMHICVLLAPKGPIAENSIFRHQSESSKENHLMSSMHSFLLAGIMTWLDEHLVMVKDYLNIIEAPEPEEVKSPDGKKEGEGEDSKKVSPDTSNVHEVGNNYVSFKWLDSIVDLCYPDLLNPQIVEYFNNLAKIKNLELKIASSTCNVTDKKEQRVVLTAVRSKNRKAKRLSNGSKESSDLVSDDNREENCSVANVSDKNMVENAVINLDKELGDKKEAMLEMDEKGDTLKNLNSDHISKSNDSDNLSEIVDSKLTNNSLLEKENSDTCQSSSVTDSDKKANNGFSNLDQNDIVKNLQTRSELETKSDSSEVKSKLSVKFVSSVDDKKIAPFNHSLAIEFDSDEDSKSLQRLKAAKSKFESEKVSTPNPVFTFCHLQNVLVSMVKHGDPDRSSKMLSKIKDSWKNANV